VLVSVVIPAFNAEQWVSGTVESVLKQTYKELEIVLVDDGSTDRTVEVAKDTLQNSRVPYRILRQPNAGAAGARNRGWQVARGTWIQFLDADDLLEPGKIELQVAQVQVERTVDVVYTDWKKLVWSGSEWKGTDFRSPILGADPVAEILSDRNFLQLGCLLFNTNVLRSSGGFDRLHEPIEDVGLCVKIAIAGGKFVKAKSSEPMSSYRDLPRSFSKTNHSRFIESCIRNAKLAERYVRDNPTSSPRIIESIVDVYFSGARYFAGYDWMRFEEIVADIEALQPTFIPKYPAQLHVLSRIAGYRKAERFAVMYRRGKNIGASLWRRRTLVQE
jgi:glycosyltransferase involved in cell wall biosynthesis